MEDCDFAYSDMVGPFSSCVPISPGKSGLKCNADDECKPQSCFECDLTQPYGDYLGTCVYRDTCPSWKCCPGLARDNKCCGEPGENSCCGKQCISSELECCDYKTPYDPKTQYCCDGEICSHPCCNGGVFNGKCRDDCTNPSDPT